MVAGHLEKKKTLPSQRQMRVPSGQTGCCGVKGVFGGGGGNGCKTHKTAVTTGDGAPPKKKKKKRNKGREKVRRQEGARKVRGLWQGRVEEERKVRERSGQTDRKGTGRDVAGASSSAKALLGSP